MYRILVVDDEASVLEVIRLALQSNGWLVKTAQSGNAALSVLNHERFDLVILDLNLPDGDGFDVLRMLRTRLRHVPTLVVSGYMDGALLTAAYELGASATMMKPLDLAELRATVAKMLPEEGRASEV